MLVTSTSHTCRSLASMKAFPYLCSHNRRPRSVQMLTSPTSSLDEMLFRNHSWNTDGLQEEPPQQHGRDRRKGADDDRLARQWLEQAPACSLNPPSLPALRLPAAFQPKANHSSSKVTSITDAGGQNSLNLRTPNICGIGYARHSDAHVAKTHESVACWHQSGCERSRSSRAGTCKSIWVTLVETQATWSNLFSFQIPSYKNQNRVSSMF